jgi:hypothetical protein
LLLPDEEGLWGEMMKVIDMPQNVEIWLQAVLATNKVICGRKHL